MKLKMQGIRISFPGWEMDDFSLEAPSGSFTSIVGPSGCGKSTILRAIAGLEAPQKGKVFFGAKEVTSTPAEERDVGLVFQGDALFSHINVFDNVAFGPRMKKEKNIEGKVASALSLVHLAGFEKRDTTTLSGGEKKRVAIARALAFSPKILLLDEPLAGLDANLREKMKSLLRELSQKTGLTTIMVTHDIEDAFSLSGRIVAMSRGKVEQEGKPFELLLRPKTRFVKEFFSSYALEKKGGKYFILKKGNYRKIK